MIERDIDIPTADGTMNGFIVHPDSGGPHPTVLFLMDAPGMRGEIHDMARRVAEAGYFVVSGNLYYRDVEQFNVFENGEMERMFELMNTLTPRRVLIDADGMIAVAEADPAADASRVGVVGYCMSGPFSIRIAAHRADVVKAAASFHGVALATDEIDSPHQLLPQILGEIYVGAAETDEYAPKEMIDAFEKALAESGTEGRVEWYPGTQHGFVFAERGPMYHQEAAERHWDVVLDLFSRRLG